MPTSPRVSSLLVALAAIGFAVAHTQAPLFFSNQNQYLLHGLANAGYGHLDRDWLCTTKDPTPLFSFGVATAYRLAGLWPLHVAFFTLLVGYFLAAWWLVSPIVRGSVGFAAFASLFTAAHAAILRVASVELTGVDYPWFLQAGMAGQYALGPSLQPSSFAVLLVASLAAFANGRPRWAAGLAAAATLFHATYLLPAALLTLGYCVSLRREENGRTALAVGGIALAVALPVVVYTLVVFPQTNTKLFQSSQAILATVRIPHHAVVGRWFDPIAMAQLVWIGVGIGLARSTRLFVPLAVAAVGGVVLTLVQMIAENHSLALLFPWRISAILVPMSTALVAVRIANGLPTSRIVVGLSLTAFVTLVAGGLVVMPAGLGYRMNDAERPLLDDIRDRAGPDDVYLIPTRFPAVGSGRGAMSASFTPPPRPKPGSNLIPVDLQRFRLATGACIYIDFKAVPYTDVEVAEWYRRVSLVQKWYDEPDWDRAGLREQLVQERITHVVIPRHLTIRATFLEPPFYADEAYRAFHMK